MIYVEHHDGPEQTDNGRIGWRPGWYAICDDCGWSAGHCLTEVDAVVAAGAHAVAMGEATPQELEPSQRRAEPGERCTCGRQAIIVYLGAAPVAGGDRDQTVTGGVSRVDDGARGDPGRAQDADAQRFRRLAGHQRVPRRTERRYSALAPTSATGPSPGGSPVRMVSCSSTYQPS